MNKDHEHSSSNIIPILPNSQASSVTIDSVLIELDNWRANKSNPSEPIPDEILEKIFSLKNHHPESRLRSVFGLSGKQYASHYQRLYGHSSSQHNKKKTNSQPEFCEVNAKAKSIPDNYEEAYAKYGPSLLPATNTVVVEYKRPDGYLLKIHTTDASFPRLLKEFATMEFD